MSEPIYSLCFTNRYLPSHYDLSLILNPAKPNFQGVAILNLDSNPRIGEDVEDGDSFSLTFNSSELIITNCLLITETINEKLSIKQDRSKQIVTLTTDAVKFSDLQNETKIQLRFQYIGIIHKINTYKDFTYGVFKTNYLDYESGKSSNIVLASHSQPNFARSIYPCIDDVLQKSTFKLTITTSHSFTCLSNTEIENSETLVNDQSPNDLIKIVEFAQTPPMTTSIFAFAIGDLEYMESTIKTSSHAEFPVRVYTQKSMSSRSSYALITACETVPILEKLFNAPYPLPKLDFLSLPFLSDGGVENWSLINVLNDHILLPLEDEVTPAQLKAMKSSIRQLITHELIHQWIGNLITFESWDYTWLNESLATFISLDILQENLGLSSDDESIWLEKCANDLMDVKRLDGSIDIGPIYVQNVQASTIGETFKKHSYDKGIFVLRMLSLLFGSETFLRILGDFINAIKFKTFKPVDIWNFMKTHELNKMKLDIPTIMNSWIRTPGYPVVSVETLEGSNSYKLEQHRFIYEAEKRFDDIEDVPYHIPLSIKLSNGKERLVMLTDRSMELKLEEGEELLMVNSNCMSIVTIKYDLKHYTKLASYLSKDIQLFSKLDQLTIVSDFSSIFCESVYQTEDVLLGFVDIVDGFTSVKYKANNDSLDLTSLNITINSLHQFSKAILNYSTKDSELTKKFYTWINNTVDKLITITFGNKWDLDSLQEKSSLELSIRNSILLLSVKNSQVVKIVAKYYKELLHGKSVKVPKELLSSIFSVTVASCTIKEYKEIMNILKSPGTLSKHILGSSYNTDKEIQTHAISSLGYSSSSELQQKTLNYITTNSDLNLIELALLGFKNPNVALHSNVSKSLWDWYVKNFDAWFVKSLKPSGQQKNSYVGLLKNSSVLVFEIMFMNNQEEKIHQFVQTKTTKYGKSADELLKDYLFDTEAMVNDKRLLCIANDKLKLKLVV